MNKHLISSFIGSAGSGSATPGVDTYLLMIKCGSFVIFKERFPTIAVVFPFEVLIIHHGSEHQVGHLHDFI
jgi:hypothetical protein